MAGMTVPPGPGASLMFGTIPRFSFFRLLLPAFESLAWGFGLRFRAFALFRRGIGRRISSLEGVRRAFGSFRVSIRGRWAGERPKGRQGAPFTGAAATGLVVAGRVLRKVDGRSEPKNHHCKGGEKTCH